ncbi:MAG: hypothetical protein LBI36_04095, partial [Oscillospiraceae bacterium]|nr:hypothetical protein [Oscillospiraceae bacterium]
MNEDIIIKARGILKALGYRMAKRDAEILALCCEEAEGEFLSACGLRTPPRDGVRHIAMRAAGEFLTIK